MSSIWPSGKVIKLGDLSWMNSDEANFFILPQGEKNHCFLKVLT